MFRFVEKFIPSAKLEFFDLGMAGRRRFSRKQWGTFKIGTGLNGKSHPIDRPADPDSASTALWEEDPEGLAGPSWKSIATRLEP